MHKDSEFVEQIFHIEEMKGELEELSEGKMKMGTVEGPLPPEVEEQFLAHVLAYERAEMVTYKELLARDGVTLPALDELTDDELALKLIEVIHSLAEHHIFLEHTNHFSDRELYAHLWEDSLNESGPVLPPDNPMNCHFDLIGSGSEEHCTLWMRYYADEETRADWAKDFPDFQMPPHVDPPYDRDRHLPKPPEMTDPYADNPELAEALWTTCREILSHNLAEQGIKHGAISAEPISYSTDFACVSSIESAHRPGEVEWWAISGDLPTTFLPAAEIPDPRAFLRIVSQRWRLSCDAMEQGDPPAELTIGPPRDWPRIIPLLRRRADYLDDWASDDDAWE